MKHGNLIKTEERIQFSRVLKRRNYGLTSESIDLCTSWNLPFNILKSDCKLRNCDRDCS
jgi:hypothetical protein